MGEWTKGPLRNDGDDEVAQGVPCIVLAAGEDCGPTHRRVAEVCHQWDGDALVLDAEARANAARIIACWNAMLGIPDPAATMKEVREVLEVAHADAVRERDGLIETEAVWTVPDEDGVQYPKMETLPADVREELALISEKVDRIRALLDKIGRE